MTTQMILMVVILLAVTYMFFSPRFPNAVVATIGAVAVGLIGTVQFKSIFTYYAGTSIVLMVGMMIVVGALRDLGFFTWVVQLIVSMPNISGRKFIAVTAVASALLACAGTNSTAKRAATVHLLFNVIGTVIFVIIACCLPLASWVEMLSPGNLKLQIAIVHILFNVTTTALLLPAASWLEKLACLLIKDDGSTAEEMKLLYFDARMLKTPPIAVAQLFNEVQRMGGIAMGNFQRAMECFNEWDAKKSEELARNEDVLDYLNREITDSLVEVKGLDLSEKDTKLVGSMFHVVNDMERIGDHSQNIMESAQLKNQDEVKFSPKAVQELESLSNLVRAQMQRSLDMFKAQVTDDTLLGEVEGVEDEIDTTTEALRSHHMDRLKNHKCSAKNGMIYLDMLTNLERIGDHAENIATSAKSATGI